MVSSESLPNRRGSGLAAWASLLGLSGLVLCGTLVLARAGPRPAVAQTQIERRGLQDALSRGAGPVERLSVYGTTLGRLRPLVPCSLIENLTQAVLLAARFVPYNPCDPATRVWVVEVWGEYPTWVIEPVRMLYTASGDFIRSEGGP